MADRKRHDERIAWWREARFGMFIHWGLYAIPAGQWRGVSYPGIGEWIMFKARIPIAEYEELAARFDPIEFNADAWASLAAEAGMKYLIITAKHHDGFALFDSPSSAFNIVQATPFKRDLIAELAHACALQGLKFGVYYSQAQDWHEPGGAIWGGPHEGGPNWEGRVWDPGQAGDFERYFESKALPQVRELLTKYGPIAVIWFDTPLEVMTDERAATLERLVRQHSPDTLISGRLGGKSRSDYESEDDNRIPRSVREGDWETPATLNDTWGYRSDDENWKSPRDVIFKLVDIISKGGNYLLNVGPDARGRIPLASQEVLRAVGSWLSLNGEAIYGAGRTPLGAELASDAVRCTSKPGSLYVHLFEEPDAELTLTGLDARVLGARILDRSVDRALRVSRNDSELTLHLPPGAFDPPATVVRIELDE